MNLHLGNCLEIMRGMAENSVDSIITDPPYGLNFMGKKWDYAVPATEVWKECLRVLKPGGHLLAFAGTRTQHRMAVRIEDAGFEIRDMIAWVYGSGFPKSLDVSKAIDKAAGAEREVVGRAVYGDGHAQKSGQSIGYGGCDPVADTRAVTAPATEAARQWQGWGTALKPALEPITVARKPLDGTVAANVLAHGTGAINVDGCRISGGGPSSHGGARTSALHDGGQKTGFEDYQQHTSGRWPANLIHDGSEEVLALAGEQARFFYCAKASKRDRDEGLEGFAVKKAGALNMRTDAHSEANGMTTADRANIHPTVKPTDLMRYLCRLVTPPSGVVLDPFMGSGSTGKAAMLEGFKFIGCELSPEYFEIAKARIFAAQQNDLFTAKATD